MDILAHLQYKQEPTSKILIFSSCSYCLKEYSPRFHILYKTLIRSHAHLNYNEVYPMGIIQLFDLNGERLNEPRTSNSSDEIYSLTQPPPPLLLLTFLPRPFWRTILFTKRFWGQLTLLHFEIQIAGKIWRNQVKWRRRVTYRTYEAVRKFWKKSCKITCFFVIEDYNSKKLL